MNWRLKLDRNHCPRLVEWIEQTSSSLQPASSSSSSITDISPQELVSQLELFHQSVQQLPFVLGGLGQPELFDYQKEIKEDATVLDLSFLKLHDHQLEYLIRHVI